MDSWFSIQAKGDDTAQISIHDSIGLGGASGSQFMADLDALGPVKNISLSIHSDGGDVLEGWAIYNKLLSHPAHVTAKVEGLAASMASVILMAADAIEIPENGWIMIHDAKAGAWGNADEIEDMAATLRKIQGGIVKAYAKRTGLPAAEISNLMSHTTYMDGAEALSLGFADKVTDSFKAAACLESWRGKLTAGVPKGLVFEARAKEDAPVADPPATISEPAQEPAETILPTDKITPKPTNTMSDNPAPTPQPLSIKDALAEDKPRREEIAAIGKKFELPQDQISHAIENGVDLEVFRNTVIDNFDPSSITVTRQEGSGESVNVGDPIAKNYSVFKAINEMHSSGRVSGLEKEVQDELSQRYQNATGEVPSGLLLPGEWINQHSSRPQNVSTVGTATTGGATVDEEMQNLTDYLKDYSMLPALGATIFRDSTGNLEFPRATAGVVGAWDAENDSIANGTATLAANLVMTPKRVGAGTEVTKQLMHQSSAPPQSQQDRRADKQPLKKRIPIS